MRRAPARKENLITQIGMSRLHNGWTFGDVVSAAGDLWKLTTEDLLALAKKEAAK